MHLEILQTFRSSEQEDRAEATEDEDLGLYVQLTQGIEMQAIRVFHSISAVYGMSEHIIRHDYSLA